jgi:8-hydroxy-5-deazaflavin:NADPH oxidoreductase
MTHLSIIGTGSMGQAIATIAGRGGHTVQLLGRNDLDAPLGDVVVLAVPYPAVASVIAARGAALAGKVVVDITNPLDVETFDSLVVPPSSSATAEIATAVPDAKVVKAFNTNFAATLASGTIGDQPTTVLIAGDDVDAKGQVAEVVTGGGLKAIDVGDLRRARELEAIAFLQITLAAAEKLPWTGGFAVQG